MSAYFTVFEEIIQKSEINVEMSCSLLVFLVSGINRIPVSCTGIPVIQVIRPVIGQLYVDLDVPLCGH